MSEDYVKREEFNNLKEEVNDIKKELTESAKILSQIDKKIDVINEKIVTADKIEDLKFNPLENRVKKIEDNQTWLWRTLAGTIIGIIIKIIFDVSKIL